MSFISDLKKANASIEAFKHRIVEHIKGELVSIELEDEQIAKWFDIYSGIDAFHKLNNQLRGVAIRCQWRNPTWRGAYPFDTFTIRYSRKTGTKTEYAKRMEAIYGNMGYLYPYLTIQAYFDDKDNPNKIMSFAIVKTENLYRFVSNHLDDQNMVKRRTVGVDGNEFLCVDFASLVKAGSKIIAWSETGALVRQTGAECVVLVQPTLESHPSESAVFA